MTPEQSVALVGGAVNLVVTMVSVLIVPGLIVGLVVSIFQAATQIQEQTLGFVAKLVAVVITLFATTAWLGNELYSFADMVLLKVPQIQ